MIASDREELVFVHVPKTGGTAVSSLLKRVWPESRVIGRKHDGLASSAFAEVPAHFQTFAFVRNPWDRAVSWFSMMMNRYESPAVNQGAFAQLVTYVGDRCSTFDQYVELLGCPPDDAPKSMNLLLETQLRVVSRSRSLETGCDMIGRFESLERDLSLILSLSLHRSLEHGGMKGVLRRENSSERARYADYYDRQLRAAVGELFEADIEAFDYDF